MAGPGYSGTGHSTLYLKAETAYGSVAAARPGRNLAALRNRAETLVDELLQALARVSFRRVEVALRVGGDAVHAKEHAGLAAAVAEVVQLGHRLAIEDANVLVGAVS